MVLRLGICPPGFALVRGGKVCEDALRNQAGQAAGRRHFLQCLAVLIRMLVKETNARHAGIYLDVAFNLYAHPHRTS